MDHLVDKEIGWMVVLDKLFSRAPWSKQRPVTTRVPWCWSRDLCCSTSLSVTRTVGSGAPSASLPMTTSCVLQLSHWRGGSTGILTGLREEYLWISWSWTRPSTRSCWWLGTIPSTNTGLAENGWRAALRRRAWKCGLMRSSVWPGIVCLQARNPTTS